MTSRERLLTVLRCKMFTKSIDEDRVVTQAVNGRAKIIAHVGTLATRDVLELATHAAECGNDE